MHWMQNIIDFGHPNVAIIFIACSIEIRSAFDGLDPPLDMLAISDARLI